MTKLYFCFRSYSKKKNSLIRFEIIFIIVENVIFANIFFVKRQPNNFGLKKSFENVIRISSYIYLTDKYKQKMSLKIINNKHNKPLHFVVINIYNY